MTTTHIPSPIGESLPLSVGAPVPPKLTYEGDAATVPAGFTLNETGAWAMGYEHCRQRFMLAAAHTAPVSPALPYGWVEPETGNFAFHADIERCRAGHGRDEYASFSVPVFANPRERNEGGGDAAAWPSVVWWTGAISPPDVLADTLERYSKHKPGGGRDSSAMAIAAKWIRGVIATPPAPDAAGRATPPPAAPEQEVRSASMYGLVRDKANAIERGREQIVQAAWDTPATWFTPEQSSAQPWALVTDGEVRAMDRAYSKVATARFAPERPPFALLTGLEAAGNALLALRGGVAQGVVVDEAMVSRALDAQPFALSENDGVRVWSLIQSKYNVRRVIEGALTAALAPQHEPPATLTEGGQ